MSTRSNNSPTPARPRVAYLLADAGIALGDSRKGSSIHARSMIRAFMQEGADVEVYTLRRGSKEPLKGFDVREVRQSRVTRWWKRRMIERKPGQPPPANWADAVMWLLWHRDFLREVRRGCRKRRPSLFYARGAWLAFPYAKLRREFGAPLALEVNAVMTLERRARGQLAFAGLTRKIEGEMFRHSDRILPVSAEIKQQIVEMFGIDPARIVVTPNAVDLDLFAPAAPWQAGTPFVVGAVNSFRAYHGMATLLRAAKLARGEMPGLRVLMIGGGPEFEATKQLAAELGIAEIVEFTGVVDHARVPQLLAGCAVAAAPYEGEHNQYNCPMKLFEYMGMKLPIVASRWGDIPNILEHGATALLHAEGDAAALAGALTAVAADPAAAQRRAEAAYAVAAEKHTWRSTARAILDWGTQP